MKENVQKAVLPTLRNMKVRETVEFLPKQYSYARSCCTMFGYEWGKKFRTHVNKETNMLEVTRVK